MIKMEDDFITEFLILYIEMELVLKFNYYIINQK